jgi:hypothetical protein
VTPGGPSTRRHVGLGRALWALGLLVACVKPVVPTQPLSLPPVPRPVVSERVDAAKPLPPSRLLVPLETDVSSYEPTLGEVLRESIVLYQEDWTRVSAPKDNLEVDTLIEARVGDPELRMDDNTALVQIPLTYWGKVRASARTRFGRIWLTKGVNWGTEKNPARVTLGISVKPAIDEYFRLRTKSKLAKLVLKAPKFARLCTSGRIRICLSQANTEKLVHGLVERRIRESATTFLGTLDRRVQQEADLRSALEVAVRVLGQPAGDDRLSLSIDRMALSPLSGSGRRARLDLELLFQPRFGSAQSQYRPVPKRTPLSKQPGFLAFDTEVSFRELSMLLGQSATGLASSGLTVSAVEVLGAAQESEGVVVLLTAVLNERTHLLYLLARPTADQGYLRFEGTRPTEPTASLLKALDIDAAALVSAFEAQSRVPLRPFADRKVASLQNRLALLTLAFAAVSLEFVAPEFGAVSYAKTGLRVRVQGEGRAQLVQ